jgi:hypothetical protein
MWLAVAEGGGMAAISVARTRAALVCSGLLRTDVIASWSVSGLSSAGRIISAAPRAVQASALSNGRRPGGGAPLAGHGRAPSSDPEPPCAITRSHLSRICAWGIYRGDCCVFQCRLGDRRPECVVQEAVPASAAAIGAARSADS